MRTLQFFITIALMLWLQPSAHAQLDKVTRENFRVNPFEGDFTSFIKALTTDPDLLNKTVVLKTDSTNFLVRGNYKIFNPFSLNAERIDMIFAEQVYDLTLGNTQSKYTVYSYQLSAYFNDSKANRNRLLKDYNKLKRRLGRDGMKKQVASLKNVKNIEDGEVTNYYLDNSLTYPATLSWQTLSSKRIALTIIVRLAVTGNRAHPAGTLIENIAISPN